ncbi:hypothetical protein P43SY_002441 [Pythium insidiosum]|uniref:protein-tyrosine-phosphatase n=1 Tax=Pythium insidiosum TaxID=114742 RepID=A0AAD5Q870_PYTIN|nr:hypothetical protein P43SY_002441 [Pythium insidiosum]
MTMADADGPAPTRSSSAVSAADAAPLVEQDRLDVPGVIDEHLLLGCVKHARNAALLKHLRVSFVLDAENPRKRRADPRRSAETTVDNARVDLDDDYSYETFKENVTTVDNARVDLDDDYSYETFKENVVKASELIRLARAAGGDNDRTVFVFCTHGNNESVVVCIAYLMLTETWTLERAYKHVQLRRPASAPRRVYVDKSRSDDADETASQVTEAESHVERASFATNMSVTTGLHNGSSLRETMIIAEREEEYDAASSETPDDASLPPPPPSTGSSRGRPKLHRKDCVIS